jgi:ribonuclease HI
MSGESIPVHIDGASRGNPGPAAFAFVIAAPGGPIEEYGKLGDTTNNIAEYTALLRALEKAAALSLGRLHIHSDSELLVKQMNGEYRVKNPEIKELYDEAQGLLRRFDNVRLTHVRREHNKRADELCNQALDDGKVKTAKPKKPAAQASVSAATVRDDCIACLQAARNAWSAKAPHAPTADQVWDQLWSVLEDGGVLKKKKVKEE